MSRLQRPHLRRGPADADADEIPRQLPDCDQAVRSTVEVYRGDVDSTGVTVMEGATPVRNDSAARAGPTRRSMAIRCRIGRSSSTKVDRVSSRYRLAGDRTLRRGRCSASIGAGCSGTTFANEFASCSASRMASRASARWSTRSVPASQWCGPGRIDAKDAILANRSFVACCRSAEGRPRLVGCEGETDAEHPDVLADPGALRRGPDTARLVQARVREGTFLRVHPVRAVPASRLGTKGVSSATPRFISAAASSLRGSRSFRNGYAPAAMPNALRLSLGAMPLVPGGVEDERPVATRGGDIARTKSHGELLQNDQQDTSYTNDIERRRSQGRDRVGGIAWGHETRARRGGRRRCRGIVAGACRTGRG